VNVRVCAPSAHADHADHDPRQSRSHGHANGVALAAGSSSNSGRHVSNRPRPRADVTTCRRRSFRTNDVPSSHTDRSCGHVHASQSPGTQSASQSSGEPWHGSRDDGRSDAAHAASKPALQRTERVALPNPHEPDAEHDHGPNDHTHDADEDRSAHRSAADALYLTSDGHARPHASG